MEGVLVLEGVYPAGLVDDGAHVILDQGTTGGSGSENEESPGPCCGAFECGEYGGFGFQTCNSDRGARDAKNLIFSSSSEPCTNPIYKVKKVVGEEARGME